MLTIFDLTIYSVCCLEPCDWLFVGNVLLNKQIHAYTLLLILLFGSSYATSSKLLNFLYTTNYIKLSKQPSAVHICTGRYELPYLAFIQPEASKRLNSVCFVMRIEFNLI